MALIGLSPDETVEVFLAQDAKKETPFRVRILTAAKHTHIVTLLQPVLEDDSGKAKKAGALYGDIAKHYAAFEEVVRIGVSGWDNLKDGKGKPIAAVVAADGLLAKESVARLRLGWITELAFAILRAQSPTGDDKGK